MHWFLIWVRDSDVCYDAYIWWSIYVCLFVELNGFDLVEGLNGEKNRKMWEKGHVNLHRWGKAKVVYVIEVSWRLLCCCMQWIMHCRDGSLDDVPHKSDPCHNKYTKNHLPFQVRKHFRNIIHSKSCLL